MLVQNGAWDDVSGETFLRNLLARGIEGAKYDLVSSAARVI
jgi:hypothetical protein